MANDKRYVTVVETVLSIAIAMGALWLFLLLSVSVALPTVAPSPYYSFSQFATIAVMLTIGIAGGGWSAYRWVGRVPPARYQIRGKQDNELSPIVVDFRIRSGLYRIAATALFILLAAVTIAGFFVVSTPARERADYHEALPGELPALVGQLTATENQRQALTQPEAIELLTVILNRSTYPGWGEVAGAVTLWLVLVQVIASLFRYMVRLASFYDSRADYLQLEEQRAKRMARICWQ